MAEQQYDVLILGGGPGGYAAAIAAAKGGLKVAVFEKEKLGGTCLNVGCIPTKYLLDKAATIEKIRKLTADGVFRDAGAFSFKKIQEGKADVVKRLTDGVGKLLKGNHVDVIYGEAKLEPDCVITSGGQSYQGKNVIIATGSTPIRIPIPGAEFTVDSTAVLNLERPPKRLTVIGGGVIGLELASAYASYGSEVTIIELLATLLPNELPQAARLLTRALTKRGVRVKTASIVKSVEKADGAYRVTYSKDDHADTVDADVVLMGVGRKPNLCGVDAAALGLKLAPKGSIEVDGHMRTSLPNVYAVGDAAGGYQLAHAAYAEAETAVANILGHDETANFDVMPRCVYTMPCFAAVGKTEAQAAAAGIETTVGSFPYEGNGMALAEGASGMVYVVMNKQTKATVGVQIVGENASELISFASAAVAKGLTVDEWAHTIVAHPSLSEMVREAALDAFGMAVHKM